MDCVHYGIEAATRATAADLRGDRDEAAALYRCSVSLLARAAFSPETSHMSSVLAEKRSEYAGRAAVLDPAGACEVPRDDFARGVCRALDLADSARAIAASNVVAAGKLYADATLELASALHATENETVRAAMQLRLKEYTGAAQQYGAVPPTTQQDMDGGSADAHRAIEADKAGRLDEALCLYMSAMEKLERASLSAEVDEQTRAALTSRVGELFTRCEALRKIRRYGNSSVEFVPLHLASGQTKYVDPVKQPGFLARIANRLKR
eukprot:m51a1_g10906 hypothetical protein (266) ;mRNA; r:56966-57903